MVNVICNVLRNCMCAFLKQNSFASQAYCHQAYAAMMLQALIPFLKIYNQSLIFISFQHIDLDAW